MFEIDFMSSLKENKINGFDLAIMEQQIKEEEEEKEKKEQVTESDDEALPLEFEDDEEPD